jgi:hypothetical protein
VPGKVAFTAAMTCPTVLTSFLAGMRIIMGSDMLFIKILSLEKLR